MEWLLQRCTGSQEWGKEQETAFATLFSAGEVLTIPGERQGGHSHAALTDIEQRLVAFAVR